ncbi:MAG TPA: VOC family protein [Candidatus Limnocylindria bacterium]|nr:VOC family protein [Candidatus Limnocylindria bacterium]
MSGFPGSDVELTTILVVSDVHRARDFWRDVVGAQVYREYGGTSCVLRLAGAWILLVTGGGPTPDKPDVTFAVAQDQSRVDHSFTMRVADCQAAYEELRARGATFVTPPVVSDWEARAFFRDPDGHLLEISEARTGR